MSITVLDASAAAPVRLTVPSSRTYSDSGSVPWRNNTSPASISAKFPAAATWSSAASSSSANPGTLRSIVAIGCMSPGLKGAVASIRSVTWGCRCRQTSVFELIGQPDAGSAAVAGTLRVAAAHAGGGFKLQAFGDVILQRCLGAARGALLGSEVKSRGYILAGLHRGGTRVVSTYRE